MSMDRDPNVYDRGTRVYDSERRGTNTIPYLIGGLVIALGVLAFLFYPGYRNNGDVSTTGSIGSDRPSASAPANPENSSPSTGTPGPAAPARPANP
jgi:hypothetical protein